MADLRFWFDPVCPFAWMTSRWVRMVAAQRDYSVEWRFISLRLLNAHVDYVAHFPPEYEAGHTAGLRLLRVASRVLEEHGQDGVARFYEACGRHVFEQGPEGDRGERGTAEFVAPVLADAGLPAELAGALEEAARDAEIQASTDEALALTGKDVGTPILHFRPDEGGSGTAFFGPVISRLPSQEQAAELWDHVVGLASFPGFAELKRSLRERPQLPAFGVGPGDTGVQEDWHGGSRRQKR
jgi:2-hydroxychromene-2-carboxylate isomerase